MQTQNQVDFDMAHFDQAYDAFLKTHPGYDADRIDQRRHTEFGRLDRLQHVYLDYTGGGLYGESQVQQHMNMLRNGVYGNPHSVNPTSMAATELTEQARHYVYEFFNADPDEFVVIFTANASGALKLVGESYPFEKDSVYLLTFDNHNSVNGIREFAKGKGATVIYSPVVPPDLRLDADILRDNLAKSSPDSCNLFAYPAQSNFSGVQHSLEWIDVAHDLGWDVVLDAAAFAPTNRLDLSVVKPDFVTLSFYKIFGYPTGIGALIARRDTLHKLHRPWFAGGTIEVASVQANTHYLAEGEAAFEDGTIDYLNIPAIEIGLRFIDNIGIDQIHDHVKALTDWLLEAMRVMHHSNGKSLFTIYGPTTNDMRGGTIACNAYDPTGKIFDFRYIEQAANRHNISLRTGCFCNPGAGELALNISADELQELLLNRERMSYEQYVEAMTVDDETQAGGAVRISVGMATTFEDVYRFMNFAESLIDLVAVEVEEKRC